MTKKRVTNKKIKSFKTDEGNFSVYDTDKSGGVGRNAMFTVLEDKNGWIVITLDDDFIYKYK